MQSSAMEKHLEYFTTHALNNCYSFFKIKRKVTVKIFAHNHSFTILLLIIYLILTSFDLFYVKALHLFCATLENHKNPIITNLALVVVL